MQMECKLLILLFLMFFVFPKFECNDEDCPIILTRSQWRAVSGTSVFYQTIPIDKIIIIWFEGGTCLSSYKCRRLVKDLQQEHISKFMMPDIAYSFLIDDNGFIYEGTGWYRRGFHTNGHNRNSLGIAFIGSSESQTIPAEEALLAFEELIECGIQAGLISNDYKLYAQRQLCYQSNNPGEDFFSIIQELPNWSSKGDLPTTD
ncbi:hypothetical protein DMENIID0001_061900 [Sergentomyia squamirostris]